MRDDIRALLRQTQAELAQLGEERSDLPRMRICLTRVAMSAHYLSKSALSGIYEDVGITFFNGNENHCSRRLRAVVQQLNIAFANETRCRDTKQKIVIRSSGPSDDDELQEITR